MSPSIFCPISKLNEANTSFFMARLSLTCVTSRPSVVSQMLCRSCCRTPANWVSLLDYRGGSDLVQWTKCLSVCLLFFCFFFFFFLFFLCFAKPGFMRGSHCWARVRTHRRKRDTLLWFSKSLCALSLSWSFYLADPVISCFLLAGPDLHRDRARVRKHCLKARE